MYDTGGTVGKCLDLFAQKVLLLGVDADGGFFGWECDDGVARGSPRCDAVGGSLLGANLNVVLRVDVRGGD